MTTIRAFAAEDATVIFGTVSDESIGDDLRVTVVATGLGRSAAKKQTTPFTIVKTGTDNAPLKVAQGAGQPVGDYSGFEQPAVWRSRDSAAARVAAMEDAGHDRLDIPAFLRKQAD
jgi:cell division protein FtsZ